VEVPVDFFGEARGGQQVQPVIDRVKHISDRSSLGPVENNPAKSAANVRASFGSETLFFEFSLDHEALSERGLYRFDIRLPANVDTIPDWIREWTMDLSNLPGWLSNPDSFDGSTTQYLSDVFERLSRDVQEIQRPTYGNLNIYVRNE